MNPILRLENTQEPDNYIAKNRRYNNAKIQSDYKESD